MKRRSFLTGLLAAPVVITTPGLLMPVKALEVPVLSHQSFAHMSHNVWVVEVPDYLNKEQAPQKYPDNWKFIRWDGAKMSSFFEIIE